VKTREHVSQIKDVDARSDGCLCLSRGHVGRRDDSRNRHATRHFHATGHPIIRSAEPDEDWLWCYPDEAPLELA